MWFGVEQGSDSGGLALSRRGPVANAAATLLQSRFPEAFDEVVEVARVLVGPDPSEDWGRHSTLKIK